MEPTKFGPFILQGTFLKRQREVSSEFADFFVDRVLTSKRMWETMVTGIKAPDFRQLLRDHTCGKFVPEASGGAARARSACVCACAPACVRFADRGLRWVRHFFAATQAAAQLAAEGPLLALGAEEMALAVRSPAGTTQLDPPARRHARSPTPCRRPGAPPAHTVPARLSATARIPADGHVRAGVRPHGGQASGPRPPSPRIR